ncbi:MAG: hypothetical protein WC505_00670 [Patescibacteria group bacterium]
MQNVHFTPPQLAPLFGVNVSTIKRWADNGYLETDLTAGGHRRISREQLEFFIKKYPRYAKNSYVLRRLLKKEHCPDVHCWKAYYRLLKNNEGDRAAEIIDKEYLAGSPILGILSKVITPTMRQMSADWSDDTISVYEEHRMSFTIRTHLMKLSQYVPSTVTKRSPSAILTCAPGEYHELPLQLLELVFKINGWNTHTLGVNISIQELIKAAKKIKPRVIISSKTYATKESPAYYKKLFAFADKNGICLAFGGGAWGKKFTYAPWKSKKCARFFPALAEFSNFLKTYRRKAA